MGTIQKVAVMGFVFLSACDSQKTEEPVYALVNNSPVFESQVLEEAKTELSEIRKKELEIKRAALQRVVTRRVLEYEMKRLGQTEDQLFETFRQNLKDETYEKAKERYLNELRRRSTIHVYLNDDGSIRQPL